MHRKRRFDPKPATSLAFARPGRVGQLGFRLRSNLQALASIENPASSKTQPGQTSAPANLRRKPRSEALAFARLFGVKQKRFDPKLQIVVPCRHSSCRCPVLLPRLRSIRSAWSRRRSMSSCFALLRSATKAFGMQTKAVCPQSPATSVPSHLPRRLARAWFSPPLAPAVHGSIAPAPRLRSGRGSPGLRARALGLGSNRLGFAPKPHSRPLTPLRGFGIGV